MSDLISRQDAIDALIEGFKRSPTMAIRAKDMIEQLPSVQPDRKKGKWIKHPEWQADGECGYECDQCGMGSDVDYDFCMRCGADMRGEKDE